MNNASNTLLPLLDFLHGLMPPSHIALVGAGNGKTALAQWLTAQPVPATLAEADDQQFAALQRQQAVGNYSEQARLLHTVVAVEAGEVAFYTSNLATESGLLPSEDLQQLWPNLHTLQSSQRKATALAQLLAPEQAHQWLLLDCLPAAALLHGVVATALAQVDVVVARVLLTEPEHVGQPAQPIPGASLAELKALLPEFTQLALQPSRHPAIAHVLLVRNYRKKQEQQAQAQKALEADLAASHKAKDAEAQAKQAALQARDEQVKAKESLQAQLQQAQQHNAELIKKQEQQAQAQQALEADLAASNKAKDAETQAKQAALQARDEQAKAKESLQAQLQQAQQHNAELIKKQELQSETKKGLEADLEKKHQAKIQAEQQREILHKQVEELKVKLHEIQKASEKEINKKFSSDADIDEFINDITPFFYNRFLTYVDIGAYVGEVLLKLSQSKTIKLREAHMFEPNPDSYTKLQENTSRLKLQKFNTYNHALGAGEKELLICGAGSMTKVLSETTNVEQSVKISKTPCHSLDSLIDLFTDHHIDLLKIDVEGYEQDVLRGASKILKEQRVDVIYIEVGFRRDGTQQTYFGEIDSILQDHGYRIFRVYEQKNEWIQDLPLMRRCNFAYMSSRFANANPYKSSIELMELKKRCER